MEVQLLSLLAEGEELRTRRWVAKKEDGELRVRRNASGESYKQLPLTFLSELRGDRK